MLQRVQQRFQALGWIFQEMELMITDNNEPLWIEQMPTRADVRHFKILVNARNVHVFLLIHHFIHSI